jgi:hypothetical protein
MYAAIAGATTTMAIGFRTSTKVDAGAHIVLHKPLEFYLFCSQDSTKRGSLPGILWCDVSVPWLFDLTVNDTMESGDYSFATIARIPNQQPQNNTFSILVYDVDYAVQDAHMHLPALQLVRNLWLSAMPLTWTMSDPGVESEIEIGFTVDGELAVDQMFSMVVLIFPEGFKHTLKDMSDVDDKVTITKDLPTLEDAVDFESKPGIDPEEVSGSILRINLDLSKELAVNTYTIAFPVMVPTTLPAWNIWQIFICKTNDCNPHPPEQSNVLVSFAVNGFEFGQLGPKSQGTRAWAARVAGFGLLFFVALEALVGD